MKYLPIAAALMFVAPAIAHAGDTIRGTIVYDKGCNSRFIVKTDNGYSLLEWYGGTMPMSGHELVGDLNNYSSQKVFDLQSDSAMQVWIDEFWLSRDQVIEKLADKCP